MHVLKGRGEELMYHVEQENDTTLVFIKLYTGPGIAFFFFLDTIFYQYNAKTCYDFCKCVKVLIIEKSDFNNMDKN